MTYDEFVTRPLVIWRQILHKSDEIARLEGLCLRTTVSFGERVQNTVENTREKNLVALSQSRAEMDEMIADLMQVQAEIREFLYDCLKVEEADVLEWKYINGKSVKEIAETLDIEEQSVRNKISRCEKKARSKYIEYMKV